MAEKKTKNEIASAKKEFLCENLSFAGKEAYKRLRTNIQFSFADEAQSHVIGITSAQPAEGKSLTAINLAYSMAQQNAKVLLIDADMRRPSIGKKLDVKDAPGLSNLLTDVNNVGNIIQSYVPSDSIGISFDILTAGDVPPNPSELLNSARMERLLGKISTIYEYVFIDLPPVGAVVDAQTVSKLVDGMLIVVRENHCNKYVVEECISQLNLTGAKILGFVMNGAVAGASKSYSYGKYGKYGSYSSSYGSNYYK